MNKFEIHVLLAGFSEQESKELDNMLSPLPINLHRCDIATPVAELPQVHVLLMGLDSLNSENQVDEKASENEATDTVGEVEKSKDEVLNTFVSELKIASPHCLAYLLAPAEKILSITDEQQEQYRDFIIYPVNNVFLKKRLFRIVNDLQDKFVQLIKKRRLKQRLEDSDLESLQLKDTLQSEYQNTKEANKHLIRMLSNQVFARMGQRASGRNQQLNLLLVEIGKACGFDDIEIQGLTDAWHLRNIGKMGFSDKILHTPYIQLSVDEQRVFNCHPTLSHAAMMIVRPLDKAAKIVMQHKEYIDGSGYPNGLVADKTSKQAQVLCVVNDYTELVAGRYTDRQYSTVEALTYLDTYATEKYDDDIVKLLLKILPALSKKGKGMHDQLVRSIDLKIGMQLTRDLICAQGILLLGEGLTMDSSTISRLQEMEMNLQEEFIIFIKQK